ncbi:MAG TPA: L,D-transpeptidase [Polyangia bacterium]|nr:L,D-transpeptidase [Polyangia bacterium]
MNTRLRGQSVGVVAVLLLVGCGQREPRANAARAAPPSAVRPPDLDYVLVGPQGATAFSTPPAQPVGATGTHLERGFGFMAAGEKAVGGRRYVQLQDGRWLAASDVERVRPSTFAGAQVAPGEPLNLAWVVVPAATVRATAAINAPVLGTRPYHARVILAGSCSRGFCPLAVGWVRGDELAMPTVARRPAEVGPREPWLDIDLASQTLVAYRGDEPRFATLVSTGIGAGDSPLATPVGTFRVRSKHAVVRMDNLEHTGVELYAYDVPLTQYFKDGKALHAAPWHDQFGRARSHGCVNVSPRDAAWLFAFTTPTLGPGAPEVLATPSHPGTVVRVRGQLSAQAVPAVR